MPESQYDLLVERLRTSFHQILLPLLQTEPMLVHELFDLEEFAVLLDSGKESVPEDGYHPILHMLNTYTGACYTAERQSRTDSDAVLDCAVAFCASMGTSAELDRLLLDLVDLGLSSFSSTLHGYSFLQRVDTVHGFVHPSEPIVSFVEKLAAANTLLSDTLVLPEFIRMATNLDAWKTLHKLKKLDTLGYNEHLEILRTISWGDILIFQRCVSSALYSNVLKPTPLNAYF